MIIKYFIIANPAAGSAKIESSLSLLTAELEKNNAVYEVHFTRTGGDAKRFARSAVAEGFNLIVSVGGDGTTSEIAGELVNTGVSLGVIPAGSGNDFPKAMNLPLNTKEAVKTVIEGNIKPADIAFLGTNTFINGLGVGMDGAVARIFGKVKKYLGQSGYIAGALIEAFRYKAFRVITDINGKKTDEKLLLFGASNGPFQGGKFNLAPEASIFDGYLDFHFVHDMIPPQRLLKIPKVLRGEKNVSKVELVKARKLEFETFTDLPAHMDGEAFTLEKGRHIIEILENGINVIVPVS